MAMIMVILPMVLSWACLVVVDIRLMMMGMIVTIVLGVVIRGRIKLIESCEEVELACHHAYWEKVTTTVVTYDEWPYANEMLKKGDNVSFLEKTHMKTLCKVKLNENLMNFNCHELKATILMIYIFYKIFQN
jgi:hypothetical protein